MRGNNRRDQNINYACCAFGLKLFATRFARSATDNPADAASISKRAFSVVDKGLFDVSSSSSIRC